MLNQFSRTELIVGKDAMNILNNAHIAVYRNFFQLNINQSNIK